MFCVYVETELGIEELTFATVNEALAYEVAAERGGWVEAE